MLIHPVIPSIPECFSLTFSEIDPTYKRPTVSMNDSHPLPQSWELLAENLRPSGVMEEGNMLWK